MRDILSMSGADNREAVCVPLTKKYVSENHLSRSRIGGYERLPKNGGTRKEESGDGCSCKRTKSSSPYHVIIGLWACQVSREQFHFARGGSDVRKTNPTGARPTGRDNAQAEACHSSTLTKPSPTRNVRCGVFPGRRTCIAISS